MVALIPAGIDGKVRLKRQRLDLCGSSTSRWRPRAWRSPGRAVWRRPSYRQVRLAGAPGGGDTPRRSAPLLKNATKCTPPDDELEFLLSSKPRPCGEGQRRRHSRRRSSPSLRHVRAGEPHAGSRAGRPGGPGVRDRLAHRARQARKTRGAGFDYHLMKPADPLPRKRCWRGCEERPLTSSVHSGALAKSPLIAFDDVRTAADQTDGLPDLGRRGVEQNGPKFRLRRFDLGQLARGGPAAAGALARGWDSVGGHSL